MPHKHWNITKIERLPEAEALITGEITLPFLVELRKEAVESLGKDAKIPGFRPGHIPEEILVKNLGEMRILEETAEIALAKEFRNIVKESKLFPIGRPDISITKLAPGIPLEFKMKIYLEPEFKLPDYKKVVAEIPKADIQTVTDKEIQDVLKEINERNIKVELKEGEKVEDKIKENLGKEKEFRAKEKHRLEIIEKLVKVTEISVPKILIDEETEKMFAQFRADVERVGAKWEDYLKQIKKTEEDIKNEWRDKARERVKAELIIAKIAEAEKLEPKKEDVEHEAEHLLHHYPDADPIRVRLYIYSQLQNQLVLEFLENLK